jgi:ribosome-binding protein aMBF1 (putative translation factor)
MFTPSPWRRVALLANSQRSICISRKHISTNRSPRKAFPRIVKTLGDHIQVKRVEKGFKLNELAKKMGVTKSVVVFWESDEKLPNEREWQLLESLFGH